MSRRPDGVFLTPKATRIIRRVLKRKGLDQKKLARRIRKSLPQLSHYLSSRNSIDEKTAAAIYKALGQDKSLNFLHVYSTRRTYHSIEEYVSPSNPLTQHATYLAPFYARLERVYESLNPEERGRLVSQLEKLLVEHE